LDLTAGRHVVGRATDADLSVAAAELSRRHFEVTVDAGVITLVDLGSANGLTVNGIRVARAQLVPGAIITAGGVRFLVAPPTAEREPTRRDRLAGLVGGSVAMRGIYDRIERIAPSDATVLVTGESGSGKEVVAAALHELSARRRGPLVTCDLAAMATSTLESELFGHVRGAFTGAVQGTLGLVRTAAGGTLFMDEIGELPADAQAKLLRVVERREVRAIGAVEATPVDVRIVAATLRPLAKLAAAGSFRVDLLHRLSVLTIAVPPLRDRVEDIGALVAHLLAQLDPDAGWRLEDDAVALLQAYPWPGNVRELRNVVQRVIARAPGPVLDVAALVRFGGLAGDDRHVASGPLPFHLAKELVHDLWERAYLSMLISRARGNVSRAAELAGIARSHLYRLLRKHHLAPAA
jgi:DNA-binding NtrC family response regulator